MKKVFFIYLFVFAFCLNAIAQIVLDQGGIAPDFSMFKGTLLILENRTFDENSINKITVRRFKSHYKGSFEMITLDELASVKYVDKTKYRFTIQLNESFKIGNDLVPALTKFIMTDRITGKIYLTKSFKRFPPLISSYAKELRKYKAKE